jgi:hypothetical protein
VSSPIARSEDPAALAFTNRSFAAEPFPRADSRKTAAPESPIVTGSQL